MKLYFNFICKVAGLCFVLCALFISTESFANDFVDKKTAVIRVMNKAAGKAYTVNIPVGTATEYEKLTIFAHSCKQTAPFIPEDFFMFAEISKKSAGKIFSGWMGKNDPGDNPLQDADWDLWLLRCE